MSDLPNNDLQIISDVDMPRLLDVSEKTWETMKKRGDRPPVTQLSERRIGYRRDHVRTWLDGKRRGTTQ
jgi:hypothetical protein